MRRGGGGGAERRGRTSGAAEAGLKWRGWWGGAEVAGLVGRADAAALWGEAALVSGPIGCRRAAPHRAAPRQTVIGRSYGEIGAGSLELPVR